MSFDVDGWVEVTLEPPAEHGDQSLWMPAICLNPFMLAGDRISNALFGLAKVPNEDAPFAGRGVPADASPLVQRELAANEAFATKYGEGSFGYTHRSEHSGSFRTRVKVVKNKMAPPFGSPEFDIRFGGGIDAIGDLLDIAAESGIVSKNGAYYTFEDESLGQGRERARQALIDRADLKSKIEALVVGTAVKRAEVEAA